MIDYWLPILGISISTAMSIWGYRQTVGATRERVRTANSELEKVLIKRIVLESYQPTVDDLSHLVGGKAREHRVKREELHSETQLLEIVYTKITESDFLTQDRRSEVLEHLSPIFAKVEKVTEEEPRIIELAREDRFLTRNRLRFAIATSASISGAVIIIIIAMLLEGGMFPTTSFIITLVGSSSIISIIFIVYRFRESREEPSARSAVQSALDFERDVISTLKKLQIPIVYHERTSGFDLVANIGESRILIEVKAHTSRPSLPYIKNTIERLNRAIHEKNADEGVIVTKEPYKLPDELLRNTKIRIMTLRELRNYMAHHSTK